MLPNGSVSALDISSPDEGIEYDYWLRLDKAPGDYYEADVDDINYKLMDYSNYITVFITNNGSEDAYIGGEYRFIYGNVVIDFKLYCDTVC